MNNDNGPCRSGVFFYLILNFFLCSCSIFQENKEFWNTELIEDQKVSSETYYNHLKKISVGFINSSDVKIKKFSKRSQKYLNSLVKSNYILEPTLFESLKGKNVSFYLIDDKRPLYFSMPERKLFLSKGLLKKYIEHESFLKNIILYEMIKIEKKVYRKEKTIPLGYYNLAYIVSLNRLNDQTRLKLDKWTYSILEKHSLDSGAYIQWIQILNSNIFDFSFYLGGKESIIKQEKDFKDFVIKNYGSNVDFEKNTSSSNGFSYFKRRI